MRVSLPMSTRGGRRVRAPSADGEHAAGRPAELQHELGRDRRLADAAADAVGTEIVALHERVIVPDVAVRAL